MQGQYPPRHTNHTSHQPTPAMPATSRAPNVPALLLSDRLGRSARSPYLRFAHSCTTDCAPHQRWQQTSGALPSSHLRHECDVTTQRLAKRRLQGSDEVKATAIDWVDATCAARFGSRVRQASHAMRTRLRARGAAPVACGWAAERGQPR